LQGLGRRAQITVIERGPQPLPHIGLGARRALLRHASDAGLRFVSGVEAARITAEGIELSVGRWLDSDFTLSVAGSRPQAWLANTGLVLNAGFVAVDPGLQSSDPLIFAAGDCVHLSHAPRPKAGVFAVREAPVLFDNLRAALTAHARRPYHPQRDYLKLVSTGGRGAVADKFGLQMGGAWLWRIKDRIDRKFMAKFSEGAQMPHPDLPMPAVIGLAEALGEKPLCGGCGAKLGPQGLALALAAMPSAVRADVLSGRGDDAAVLRHGAAEVQIITTDHLRAITADARLMARIAAVHALGDVFAMGARPQVALAQVILPRMSDVLAARTLAEIMDEAARVFGREGADVVGGHSSIGAELTIGFTVTGLAQRVIAKGGAVPGDMLVLTKPLGSGTILAAEMAMARIPGVILGEVVAETYRLMCESLGPGAAVLGPAAHALTDVTGFGLAGHLLEICAASGCGAEIGLHKVPLMTGAEALAVAGQRSSLAPANRAACLGRMGGALAGPRADLLFDPQTCGGLLAAVPEAALAGVMAALGGQATVIGRMIAGPAELRVI
jgi:selenide,water dikinase